MTGSRIAGSLRERRARLWGYCQRQGAGFWVELALVAAVLFYGALLRFEALYWKYRSVLGEVGPVEMQASLARLVSRIRPETFDWIADEALAIGHYPYTRDQRGYLTFAREMSHFYDVELREPLFVATTKVALFFTGGHDIALSFTSTFFASLLVLATYALGRSVGGRSAGLIAALLIAIEQDLIWWGTDGWRDDLFGVVTVLFACACVAWWRRPSKGLALVTGTAGALVCLTRISALEFVPVLIAVLPWPRAGLEWRKTASLALLAAATVTVLVAPYLVHCWIETGHPFIRLGIDQRLYGDGPSLSTGIVARVTQSPVETLDSVLRGLTLYPWSNKWSGLAFHWSNGLAAGLAVLSVAGVLAWLWTSTGRLLLLIMAGSMLAFAYIWELTDGARAWRLTIHMYPFFIVAALWAVQVAGQSCRTLATGKVGFTEWARDSGLKLLASAGLAGAFVALLNVLPMLQNIDELWRGRTTSIVAGPYDTLYFGDGWQPRQQLGNQVVRFVEGGLGTLRVPLLGGRAYRVLLRLDPNPDSSEAAAIVGVSLNRERLLPLRLTYDPERIGSYELLIPAGWTRTGLNRLDLLAVAVRSPRVAPGGTEPSAAKSAFMIWYVRFEPLPEMSVP